MTKNKDSHTTNPCSWQLLIKSLLPDNLLTKQDSCLLEIQSLIDNKLYSDKEITEWPSLN